MLGSETEHYRSSVWHENAVILTPTCFSTTFGSMSGTRRMENLPMTFRGMTVFAPASEKAPSIPWRDRDGYLHLCIKICSCVNFIKGKEKDKLSQITDKEVSVQYNQWRGVACLGAVQQLFHTNILAVFFQVKLNLLVQALLLVRQGGHTVAYPRNHNLPPFVYQGAWRRHKKK